MSITLGNIKTLVRELTRLSLTTQLTDADLGTEINYYYQNVMPLQIYLPECKGTLTITTADTESSSTLPAATLKIFPPVRIGSGASPTSYKIGGYYTEPAFYYSKHDGSDTKGTPQDTYLDGRTVYFAPAADGVYKIIFDSIEQPTALSSDASTIVNDRLRDLIAISVAITILNQKLDDEAKNQLAQILPVYVNVLSNFGIQTDPERMVDARNKPIEVSK
jgi:hypothetical protein